MNGGNCTAPFKERKQRGTEGNNMEKHGNGKGERALWIGGHWQTQKRKWGNTETGSGETEG
jgi:hypothetical protein